MSTTTAAHRSSPRPASRQAPRPISRPAARPVPQRAAARPNYRRRRIVVGTLAIAVVAFVVLTFAGGNATADGDAVEGPVRPPAVYVVKPGDSLWSIVEALAPERDPRPLVASLKRAAGGADLKVGQRIMLPPALAGE